MASEKTKAEETAKAPAKEAETVYTAAELADGHATFGTAREIVVVALKLAGVKNATYSEAKVIIEKFKNREVK